MLGSRYELSGCEPSGAAAPALVLEVDDIQAEFDRISKTHYPIYEDMKVQEWGLTDFRIVDPDSYYIRFTSKT